MSLKKKSAPPVSTKRGAQLAELAFQRLQRAILSQELKQGEPVREQKLAREWKMGRTPMREAFRRAAESGFLILRPNKAPTVRLLSPDDIHKIYSIRELLECQALREAEKNIKPEEVQKLRTMAAKADKAVRGRLAAQLAFDVSLHDLWFVNCENRWLTQTIERLLIYRPQLSNLLSKRRALAEAGFEEHKAILSAIEEDDYRNASRLLGLHIRGRGATVAEIMQSSQAIV